MVMFLVLNQIGMLSLNDSNVYIELHDISDAESESANEINDFDTDYDNLNYINQHILLDIKSLNFQLRDYMAKDISLIENPTPPPELQLG